MKIYASKNNKLVNYIGKNIWVKVYSISKLSKAYYIRINSIDGNDTITYNKVPIDTFNKFKPTSRTLAIAINIEHHANIDDFYVSTPVETLTMRELLDTLVDNPEDR